MLHDYHLYTAPGDDPRASAPTPSSTHFVHIPWSQPDSWRILPGRIREAIFRGMLANDIIGFHTSAYCRNFLRCCDELLEVEVDFASCTVIHPGGETLVARLPALDRRRAARAGGRLARGRRGRARGARAPPRAPDHPRRPRRPLEERPARLHRLRHLPRSSTRSSASEVTFIAHLQPSRQDVPEYAEYLERIEALVAVVNHRHGTTDWMPIDLKIYENFFDAVARYKHFDLLMVNSIFDGMNLVAKEAPAVNTRDGVLMLSENTGSHEELADCALSVNPFDIQEQADTIYRALTMDPEERRLRAQRLKEIIYSRNPGDWVDEQLADIEELRRDRASGAEPARTGAGPA